MKIKNISDIEMKEINEYGYIYQGFFEKNNSQYLLLDSYPKHPVHQLIRPLQHSEKHQEQETHLCHVSKHLTVI